MIKIHTIVAFLVGVAAGLILGILLASFQEQFGWNRQIVGLILFFGVSAPLFFMVAPIENRVIWKKYEKNELDKIDIDFAFPPILFTFCLLIICIPYAFYDLEIVKEAADIIFR